MPGAFEETCRALMDDAMKAAQADIEGKPYTSPFDLTIPKRDKWLVLEDFTYHHSDQDVNHGTYHFKKDRVIETNFDDWFMTDRSKLRLIVDES